MCYNVITEDNFNFHVHQVYLAIELSITTESWTVHFVNKIMNTDIIPIYVYARIACRYRYQLCTYYINDIIMD